MLIIVITVVIEGIRAPSDLRGDIKGYLLVRPQFFQAVGVISFGELLILLYRFDDGDILTQWI